ncbi:hypothetical protein Glove_21g149 [Diversispora epigaea]|uniref:Uncharacterized protein n=1 Tax=Diversispora epigaea TaxID=1348612 RepID=A0A397JWQ7_9GLOM|nr:hypothetical protein Glove_21g149 [Diversispora epigaea]
MNSEKESRRKAVIIKNEDKKNNDKTTLTFIEKFQDLSIDSNSNKDKKSSLIEKFQNQDKDEKKAKHTERARKSHKIITTVPNPIPIEKEKFDSKLMNFADPSPQMVLSDIRSFELYTHLSDKNLIINGKLYNNLENFSSHSYLPNIYYIKDGKIYIKKTNA